jgi:hypothetical protein
MTGQNRTSTVLTLVAVVMAALGLTPTSAHAAPISATGWNVDFILGNGETHAAYEKPVNANIWFAEDSTVGAPGLLAPTPDDGAVIKMANNLC